MYVHNMFHQTFIVQPDRRLCFRFIREVFARFSEFIQLKNLVEINYRGVIVKQNFLSIIATFYCLRNKINMPKNLMCKIFARTASASERRNILAIPHVRDAGIFSQFIAFFFSQGIFVTQLKLHLFSTLASTYVLGCSFIKSSLTD